MVTEPSSMDDKMRNILQAIRLNSNGPATTLPPSSSITPECFSNDTRPPDSTPTGLDSLNIMSLLSSYNAKHWKVSDIGTSNNPINLLDFQNPFTTSDFLLSADNNSKSDQSLTSNNNYNGTSWPVQHRQTATSQFPEEDYKEIIRKLHHQLTECQKSEVAYKKGYERYREEYERLKSTISCLADGMLKNQKSIIDLQTKANLLGLVQSKFDCRKGSKRARVDDDDDQK